MKKPNLMHFRAMADLNRTRLQPPADMPAAQQVVWHQTVDNLPDDWFAAEHTPMLSAYCAHVVRLGQIEAALQTLDPLADLTEYDKLVKLASVESGRIAMHARAMRLTQQARLKAETAHSRGAGAASAAACAHKPWDTELLA